MKYAVKQVAATQLVTSPGSWSTIQVNTKQQLLKPWCQFSCDSWGLSVVVPRHSRRKHTQVIWHDHKWVTGLISVFKQRFKQRNRKLPSPAWSYLLEDLVQKTSAVSRHSFSSQFQSLIHTHCSRCALNRCTEVSVCYLGKGQSFKQRHSRPGLHPECYLSYTLTNLQRDTRKCWTTVFIQKDLRFKPAVRLMKHPVTQQYQSIEQVKFVFQTLDV